MVWPSKKIIPIYAACGIATASIAFAVLYVPHKAAVVRPSLVALAEQANKPEVNVKNTDLANWQDTLAKFDISNGVQISAADEPAKDSRPTATSQLARDIVSSYVSLKKANQNVTDEEQAAIVENAILKNELQGTLSSSHGTIYTEYDLKISPGSSKEAVRAYGNAVGNILATKGTRSPETELSILNSLMSTGNKADVAKFDPIIASYTNIINALLATPVPESMSSFHLTLINQFSTAIAIDENMKKIFSDPAIAISALKEYESIATDIGNTLKAGSKFMLDQGITYGRTETGYVFTHAI